MMFLVHVNPGAGRTTLDQHGYVHLKLGLWVSITLHILIGLSIMKNQLFDDDDLSWVSVFFFFFFAFSFSLLFFYIVS